MGAILGALTSIAGGVMNNIQNRLLNMQNNATQRELLDMQQKWSHNEAILADERQRQQYLDLFSPQARLNQLKQAGLSVGMMYGANGAGGVGTTSGNQATTPTATSRQTIPMNNVMDTAARILAENELIKSQTRKNNSEAAENESKIPVNEKTANLLEQEIDETKEKVNLLKEQVNTQKQETKYKEALTNYNTTLDNLAKIDLQYKDNINQATISKLWQEYDNLVEDGRKLEISNEELYDQIHTSIQLSLEQIALYAAQEGLFGAEQGYYDELKRQIKRSNDVNEGFDDVINSMISMIDENEEAAKNSGKLKGLVKALNMLARIGVYYFKVLGAKPGK